MANKKLVVLGVCAHPDDMEFGAGGTVAKFSRDGAECHFVVCTDGSKGTRVPGMTARRLAAIREKEQLSSAKILGVKSVTFLKHVDGELFYDLKLRKEIVREIRRLKPDIVITHDPYQIYSENFVNHSDHRAVGAATIDATFPASRNPMTFPDLKKEGLEPHRVSEMYIMNMSNPNFAVDISKTVGTKIKAMAQHKSQGIGQHPEFLKEFAARFGKKFKCKYAEPFYRIKFFIQI